MAANFPLEAKQVQLTYLIQDVSTSEYFSGVSAISGEPLFSPYGDSAKVFDSSTRAHAWRRTLTQETTRKLVVVYNA